MEEISDHSTLHEDTLKIESVENENQQEIRNDIKKSVSKSIDAVNVKLSKTKFFLVILALIVSLTMSSLDISIVSTALPTISNQFDSKDEYTWVITAYMLGNTSFQPMFGKFSDIFGRRPVMIFALVLFVITSALCGAAHNIKMLIVARGFQGIAGGGILAMTNIIIADIVPLRQRGMYMGIVGAVFCFSSVIGPLIGGFFTDHLSWRWAFYINCPIGVIAVIVIALFVNIPTPPGTIMEKFRKIDFLGTIVLVLSVVSLLLGLSWGGSKYSWGSTVIILLFVGFCIGFTIYLFIEWKVAKEPLTPFAMFKNRNVGLSCLISFFMGIVFLGFTNTVPLLYQDGRGISATMSGLRLVPQSIFISVGNIGSGYLIGKYGYVQRYMRVGAVLLIIGAYLVTLFGIGFEYIYEFFILSFFGLAVGLIMQNTVLVTQQSAEKRFLAIGTTLINFFRLIGGVLGVTLVGTLISNKFPEYYEEVYPKTKVVVNDVHKVPDGEIYYTKAIQFTYRAILIPAAIITLIFTLFYGFVPAIGNRKKEIKMKEMELKEKESKNIEVKIDNSDSNENTPVINDTDITDISMKSTNDSETTEKY